MHDPHSDSQIDLCVPLWIHILHHSWSASLVPRIVDNAVGINQLLLIIPAKQFPDLHKKLSVH